MSSNNHDRWIFDFQVLDVFLHVPEQQHPSGQPTVIISSDPQSRMIQKAIISFSGDETVSKEPKHDEL